MWRRPCSPSRAGQRTRWKAAPGGCRTPMPALATRAWLSKAVALKDIGCLLRICVGFADQRPLTLCRSAAADKIIRSARWCGGAHLDFDLTEEQQQIREQIGSIVKSFPDDYWRKKDSKAEFPTELWEKLASGGGFGLNVPEEYGGAGLGMLELSLAVQAVAMSGGGVMGGNLFTVSCAMVPNVLVSSGSARLKEKFLPLLAKGKLVSSIVMTEPGAGVDTFGITTFAEKKRGE